MSDEAWRWNQGPMTLGQVHAVLYDDLRFCGCGSPEDAAAFILELLKCYSEESEDDRVARLFNRENLFVASMSDGALYFALYQLDGAGLTEHGGSVPGWLTEKGIELRAALLRFGPEATDGTLDYITGEVF